MAVNLNNQQQPRLSLLKTSDFRETRRKQCHCHFVTYIVCLFAVLVVALAFFYTQRQSCQGYQHSAAVTENGTAVEQQVHRIIPNAHLTASAKSSVSSGYLPWEYNRGDAHLHLFDYDDKEHALVVPQKGRYSLYLHVTYRMATKPCTNWSVIYLEQEVFLWSDSYKKDRLLMKARDYATCTHGMWIKSVHVTGVYSLEAGDRLKVKVQPVELIDFQEKSLYFGAFLVAHESDM